ncbi:MAG: hypothetical protein ABEH81_13555 [Halopenitus sp.]
MVPGFVQLGVLAVLFQLLVLAGFYGYCRWQLSAARSETRTRTKRVLGGGVALAVGGQLLALGAVGSLRTHSLLSLDQAFLVQDVGLAAALLGYVLTGVGFALYCRDND